jgi:membrane fusion protein (multidrug efflux system)
MNAPDAEAIPDQIAQDRPFLGRFLIFSGIVSVTLVSLAIFLFWNKISGVESTNNATVFADVTSVQPQVSGYVKVVAVSENQHVRRGDTVVRLYTDHFEAVAAERLARVKTAKASLSRLAEQMKLQQEIIKASQADVVVAQKNYARAEELLKSGAGSQQSRDERLAALQRNQATLAADQQQIAVLRTQEQEQDAGLAAASAAHKLAQLDIDYSHIWAADDGIIADKNVEIGEWLNPGKVIFRIVSNKKWVVANFKETQITHMRPGQRADISLDTYPGIGFCGEIESFSPATGAVFSLAPADNATGNFTKIVQRVPVKIRFKDNNPLLKDIKAGLSAEVLVNIRSNTGCSG